MRGFAGILLLLAIILAGGILLMGNMQIKQEYSFKEIIPQTKAQISNFEITLKQMTQGCDFNNANQNIGKICIDGNIITLNNAQTNPDCAGTLSTKIIGTDSYSLVINCSKKAFIGAKAIQLDLNHTTILKKY